jgi:hypothetical protein
MINNFMRYILIICSIFFSFSSFSQVEKLSPLEVSLSGQIPSKRSGMIDSSYVFISDTLLLPLIDDFSTDKFEKYDTSSTSGVTKKVKYFNLRKKIDELPLYNYSSFTAIPTYRYIHDSFSGNDTVLKTTSIPIIFSDLSSYPIKSEEIKVYSAYSIYDTLGVLSTSDTIYNISSELSLDSILVFEKHINNPTAYWLDTNVYHNYSYAYNPWTLGVATFDGLNAFGYPYSIDTDKRGYGDYLTSKPIDLSGLGVKDSIYISFLYQPKGFGDAPENTTDGVKQQHDSLCLQFYNPTYKEWRSIWSSSVPSDPILFNEASKSFFKVHLPLLDSTYFQKSFQFRFVNYSDLSGSLDHFHLDYVKLKYSEYKDTLFKDFAFCYPLGSILKDYTSVPWKHYLASPTGRINDSLKVVVRNGSNVSENNLNGDIRVFDRSKNILFDSIIPGSLLSNNDINYLPFTTYLSYYSFANNLNLISNLSSDSASFIVEGTVSAPFENEPSNDTSITTQVFKDYYAYDDGSAEVAYGLTASQARLSYRFNSYIPDSLVGVSIYFVPSVKNKSNKLFSIGIWKDQDGLPGELIYQDNDFSPKVVKYLNRRNEFQNYYFDDFKRIGVDSTFFIGIKQFDNESLNLGFDLNTNSKNNIFYSMDNSSWSNTSYSGSLMIRPIFSSPLNKTVEIKQKTTENTSFEIYPNPTNSIVRVKTNTNKFEGVVLKDLYGKQIQIYSKEDAVIDLQFLSSGIYFFQDILTGDVVKIIKN